MPFWMGMVTALRAAILGKLAYLFWKVAFNIVLYGYGIFMGYGIEPKVNLWAALLIIPALASIAIAFEATTRLAVLLRTALENRR